jgi:hypothetical protein
MRLEKLTQEFRSMRAVEIIRDEANVDAALAEHFGVTRAEFLSVVMAAVGARAEFVPDQPVNAGGLLSYIYGTGALRSLLCGKGWTIDRTDGIEATLNAEGTIKIVFQNADRACDVFEAPKAISEKGPAAERAIDSGQGFLFGPPPTRASESGATIWYLFVANTDDGVCAEISWPRPLVAGQFAGFHKRIFLLNPGEWDEVDVSGSDTGPVPDFDVKITRKK